MARLTPCSFTKIGKTTALFRIAWLFHRAEIDCQKTSFLSHLSHLSSLICYFYFILFYFILFYFILLHFILFYSFYFRSQLLFAFFLHNWSINYIAWLSK